MAAFQRVRLDETYDRCYAAVQAAKARGQDLRPALQAISRAGVTQTRRRFQAQRGPNGQPWKPSRKPSGQTLILKGLLLRSISDRPPTANSVEWGSNRIYAGVHQFGSRKAVPVKAHERSTRQAFGRALPKAVRFTVDGYTRKNNTPARPFLGINDQDLAEHARILLRHLGEPLGAG